MGSPSKLSYLTLFFSSPLQYFVMLAAVRLCTFQASRSFGLGLLTRDNYVVDLASTTAHAIATQHSSMLSLINDPSSEEIIMLLEDAAKSFTPGAGMLPGKDCTLLAPIPRPNRNVFCVGKNYIDHVQEINTASGNKAPVETPKYAQFFTKAPECVIGPGVGIPAHEGVTKGLDYEVELGVVIGKKGTNITKESALDHIFGWTIGNDISARDLQKRHTQFFKGSSREE